MVKAINQHLHSHYLLKTTRTLSYQSETIKTIQKSSNNNSNHIEYEQGKFIQFLESLIKSDPNHQGYISSCVRGSYNNQLLFFNIGGNYRYCPRKGTHHQNNSVAILIDTKRLTYAIRCKDPQCDNTFITWTAIN